MYVVFNANIVLDTVIEYLVFLHIDKTRNDTWVYYFYTEKHNMMNECICGEVIWINMTLFLLKIRPN